MEAKTFEIRDKATFIPILAVRMNSVTEEDRYLLARAGYGQSSTRQGEYVQLIRIDGGEGRSDCDPNNWSRTLKVAHKFIVEYWGSLPSGWVVDVEYILGETKTPKLSERVTEQATT